MAHRSGENKKPADLREMRREMTIHCNRRDKKATFFILKGASFTSRSINQTISCQVTSSLADLQTPRADFYPVTLHLQDVRFKNTERARLRITIFFI